MTMTNWAETLFTRVTSVIIGFFYRKWSNSWKMDVHDRDKLAKLISEDEPVILAFWHGKFLPLFALLEGQDMVVFTSDCFRGKIISRIGRLFGHKPSLIPTSGKGGAFRQMHRSLKTEKLVAFAIDGPLGPQHEAKLGTIKLASMSGHAILPVSVASRRKIVSTKRWDKREWPCWGARVALSIGEPIYIPAGIKGTGLTEWAVKVAQAINEAEKHADEPSQK